MPPRQPTPLLTLLAKLAADPLREGCRDWPGSMTNRGYPKITLVVERRRVTRLASHVALELDGRPRPSGANALHSCDRPVCVAPWHLRWGSQSDNVEDAFARARYAVGERHVWSKLTDAQVAAIRADCRPHAVVAAAFGVSESHVYKLRSGLARIRQPAGTAH